MGLIQLTQNLRAIEEEGDDVAVIRGGDHPGQGKEPISFPLFDARENFRS
ncbi:hypothetical protein ES703_08381 [subsurface metagenome]